MRKMTYENKASYGSSPPCIMLSRICVSTVRESSNTRHYVCIRDYVSRICVSTCLPSRDIRHYDTYVAWYHTYACHVYVMHIRDTCISTCLSSRDIRDFLYKDIFGYVYRSPDVSHICMSQIRHYVSRICVSTCLSSRDFIPTYMVTVRADMLLRIMRAS